MLECFYKDADSRYIHIKQKPICQLLSMEMEQKCEKNFLNLKKLS